MTLQPSPQSHPPFIAQQPSEELRPRDPHFQHEHTTHYASVEVQESFQEEQEYVADIKPLDLPIPNLTTQSIRNILLRHARTKLKISTSYPSSIPMIGKRIQGKETLDKVKVGMNSKESLA